MIPVLTPDDPRADPRADPSEPATAPRAIDNSSYCARDSTDFLRPAAPKSPVARRRLGVAPAASSRGVLALAAVSSSTCACSSRIFAPCRITSARSASFSGLSTPPCSAFSAVQRTFHASPLLPGKLYDQRPPPIPLGAQGDSGNRPTSESKKRPIAPSEGAGARTSSVAAASASCAAGVVGAGGRSSSGGASAGDGGGGWSVRDASDVTDWRQLGDGSACARFSSQERCTAWGVGEVRPPAGAAAAAGEDTSVSASQVRCTAWGVGEARMPLPGSTEELSRGELAEAELSGESGVQLSAGGAVIGGGRPVEFFLLSV
mmetsp:Transcript_26387/g.84592  ORF Transcript_26387/g.84592 Transcript_26387/m.84592 type:complete len:318 (-) Transcript_26387:89-1042(-)